MKPTDDIIGGWIRNAQESGEIKNLPGYGKRLELEDDSHIPVEYRMTYRILKNAGVTPPEVDHIKQIAMLKEKSEAASDENDRLAIQAEIRKLQLELDVALEKFKAR